MLNGFKMNEFQQKKIFDTEVGGEHVEYINHNMSKNVND